MTRTDPATAASGAAFDELLRGYYRAWFRYHPEAAVDAGVTGYAHLLTPFTEEEMGALVCLNDELTVGLEEIDPARLDADRRIDYWLARGAAGIENRRLLELDPRQPDPMRMVPVNAIYQLTIRPVDDFAAALRARLEAIPGHLAAARDFLVARASLVPRLWAESAATAAAHGVEFLRALPSHPKLAGLAARERLSEALAQAGQALAGYAEFLRRDVVAGAQGEVACGARYFEQLLRQRHFLDVEVDRLYAFGQRLAAETESGLRRACRALIGSDDIAAALNYVRREHPRREELLAAYRQQMQAAREFLAARDLVTLPARERLEVVETPVFLRHQIPFAAYCDPAPNDPEQHGYYYVTPPADEAELAGHDFVGIGHTCVHEAWPGHHLHFVSTNLNPVARSLPRLLNASAACYEGWALYSEQLMHEQGFLTASESRFVLLRDRLWRALRILIDIDLHVRGLAPAQAAERLVRQLGFAPSQAAAEITWYSRAPTVPLGYATGWAVIGALRRRALAEGMTLKAFHDRLLSAGAIALPLAIGRAFGETDWAAVRDEVFPAGAQA